MKPNAQHPTPYTHDAEGPPCRHMEGLLQRAADGSSRGFARWYALAHAARCERCGRFLMRLEEMLGRLRKAKDTEPSSDVMERLKQGAWRDETG